MIRSLWRLTKTLLGKKLSSRAAIPSRTFKIFHFFVFRRRSVLTDSVILCAVLPFYAISALAMLINLKTSINDELPLRSPLP
jgi:hypothetical protein